MLAGLGKISQLVSKLSAGPKELYLFPTRLPSSRLTSLSLSPFLYQNFQFDHEDFISYKIYNSLK